MTTVLLLVTVLVLIAATSSSCPPEKTTPCRCNDLTKYEARARTRVGNCLTKYRGRKWCYVNYNADCGDVDRSSDGASHFSFEACDSGRNYNHVGKEKDADTCECNSLVTYAAS